MLVEHEQMEFQHSGADLERRWPFSTGHSLSTHVGAVVVTATRHVSLLLLLWTPRRRWDDGSCLRPARDRAGAGDSFSFSEKLSFVASGQPVRSWGNQGGRLISCEGAVQRCRIGGCCRGGAGVNGQFGKANGAGTRPWKRRTAGIPALGIAPIQARGVARQDAEATAPPCPVSLSFSESSSINTEQKAYMYLSSSETISIEW